MAIKRNREYRNFVLPIETRAGEGNELECRVAGYAATFDEYSLGLDWDGNEYFERIDPRAFDGADMSDVIFLYNHEGMVYARQKNGTMELSVDEHGLKVLADLSKTEAARKLYESIQAGMIDQMSFAFTVREDSYDRDTRTRTIVRFDKIYDVSAVSIPANPDTDIAVVSARDYIHGVMEVEKAERLEREKKAAAMKQTEKKSKNERGYKPMTYRDIEGLNIVGIDNKIADLTEQRKTLAAGEVTDETNAELKSIDASIKALEERKAELEAIEKRTKEANEIAHGAPAKQLEGRNMATQDESAVEKRAKKLLETGRMEVRAALLTSGVLTPSAVKQEIGELPETMSTIVDDVNAFSLDGTAGAWQFAYRETDAKAETVTENEKIGGDIGTFKTGDIKPETWGVLDEISNQVKHFSPLAYEASVRNGAYLALRRYAKNKIAKEILKSTLVDKVKIEINEMFVRTLVLGFNADESVAGGAKLYLTKKTLQKIGGIRGVNEKKPVFDIAFTDENNGTITDGGLVVNFSILSDLSDVEVCEHAETNDVMIYGQMKSVDMPLWGDYIIETDEGGGYFARNMMGVRGIQSAGVGVTRKHTVQIINSENP